MKDRCLEESEAMQKIVKIQAREILDSKSGQETVTLESMTNENLSNCRLEYQGKFDEKSSTK